MAMTLIAEPQDFTPAYNPCKFIYNSTNKNNEGFRYIFDVYEEGTSNKIAEYRVLPTFGTGYGEVDLSKLLGAKVAPDFQPTNYSESDTPNTRYNYDVKVGEEYIVTFNYTANLVNNAGNVKITPTVAHTFLVGDQVVVDAGTNTLISGLWTVIAVTGTTDFTINASWSNVVDATENGTVKYADNRKTIIRDIATTLDKWVFNGALPWVQFNSYDLNDYLLNDSSARFLTSAPVSNNGLTITPTQEIWFNGFNNGVTGRMVFNNSNGDSFYYDVTNTEITTQLCVASPNLNLTVLSGTAPLIKADTTYYDFYFIDASAPTDSKTYRFDIDQRCAINDFHLVFLDRMGSWGSFAFQLRFTENGSVVKQSFNKVVEGYVSGTEWVYANTEAGLTTYSSTVDKMYTLNTNWMSEEMAIYFQELISSPSVYFYNGGDYLACQVMDNTFEVEKKRNKNLFKKTVTIKLANQDKVNI
jgi:hypothetical protein